MSYSVPTLACFDRLGESPPAGTGESESIHPQDWGKFDLLNLVTGWRDMLSDLFTREVDEPLFELDGHTWASAEHYLRADRYKYDVPEYYCRHALDSGSELSRHAITTVDTVCEDQYVGDEAISAARRRAIYTKFRQNPDLARILLLTKNAMLTCRTLTGEIILAEDLMALRERFSE